jgi:CHAD domain-containing protein
MTATRIDKWITDVSPDDRTSEVARQTLAARLGAVQHFLPLAAEKTDEDVEHVHALRVFTRRAAAALKLYAVLLPRRRGRWMREQLKKIRRAANDARDYDVLIQRWAGHGSDPRTAGVLEDLRRRRARAQRLIVASHERLQGDQRFERKIEQLLRRVRPRAGWNGPKDPPFGKWARASLRPLVESFFAAAPPPGEDGEALHQFRIRGKDLRYAMELLAGAFPADFRDQLYPVIEALQDWLGEINDHATARARLRQRIKAADEQTEVAHLRALFQEETERFEQSRKEFWAWWTPRRQTSLRAGFDTVLGRPCQTAGP